MSERKTYSVTVLIDASKSFDVKADSPKQAEQKALDDMGSVSICHQCSKEIETGDPIGAHVYDGDKLVLDTTWDAQRIAKLTAERDELLAALREAREALRVANETPNGPITDTIWMMDRPETLFDFIDAAIAKATGSAA